MVKKERKSMYPLLFRSPRILAIFFILFLSIFSLDAFQGDRSLLQNIWVFCIHMIPSRILIIILLISWKKELVGAVFFTGIGLLYVLTDVYKKITIEVPQWATTEYNFLLRATIALPIIITWILFFFNRRFKKRNT